ncbi:MAG: AlpA family phage regulatory protein [Burkholderiales bacterium]|nr:AlpA family phage regulatory protein [Burkholderiales bacterium]
MQEGDAEAKRTRTKEKIVVVHPDGLLRVDEVQVLAKKSRSSIFKDVKLNRFPAPVRSGPRWTRWHAKAVLAFVADPAAWIAAQTQEVSA